MRKIKAGDKVVVKRPGNGCMGAYGKKGVVIDKEIHGLNDGGVLVTLESGEIWRVNTDSLDFLKPDKRVGYTVVLSNATGDGISFSENDLQEVMENVRYFLGKGFTVTIVPTEVQA